MRAPRGRSPRLRVGAMRRLRRRADAAGSTSAGPASASLDLDSESLPPG